MVRPLIASIGSWLVLAAAAGAATPDPIRIALVEERGAGHVLEALHGEQGFRLGLDYATNSTLTVRERPIELAIIDDGGDPAAGRLAASYREGKADLAVDIGSSEVALALLPVAASSKRILLVAAAHADAITGSGGRYVFRTAASAGQQALAEALALARPELNLLVAAQDTRDGHDAVAALKAALEHHPTGAFFIGSLPLPPRDGDIVAAVSAELDGFHDLHGAKTLLTLWAGANPPLQAIAATDPGRFGIRLALAGTIDPNAALPGVAFEGVTPYFDTLPHNPVNDWLVAAWRDRYHERPDGFVAGGMAAALALVAALQASSAIETEALVATMEGLRFATPKGDMIFRKEDHQALQVMYHVKSEPQVAGGAPVLVREFAISELPLPSGPGSD